MPELPEVETVMRGLAPAMTGARIETVEQRRPDLRFPLPDRFVERLQGRLILGLARRAKYILADIEGGETLLMHLGMTGRFTVSQPPVGTATDAARRPGGFTHAAGGDTKHDHVVFRLEGGAVVTYNDARRFGYMELIAAGGRAAHPMLVGLGIEPLGNGLSPGYLAEVACRRTTDLKAFLMDQRIIAGLGNIYVCEALHRARLKPSRPASCLAGRSAKPTAAAARLAAAVREVLEEAIAAGGSTLRDYQHTDGSLGYFQKTFAVYGREGQACTRPGCPGTVRRVVQAGRSTFHCTRCQR